MKNNFAMAFDLDGVLFDFESVFCEKFGHAHRDLYDLYNRYPNGRYYEIEEFINSPQTYENLPPIFGGLTLLHEVANRGIKIVYLTQRPRSAKLNTMESMSNYSFPNAPIFFTDDKFDTVSEWNMVNPDCQIMGLVDDNPIVLAGLPTWVKAICWEQPWNRGIFPRARYNEEEMNVEIQHQPSERFVDFWENK